jgi:hypothetical protein
MDKEVTSFAVALARWTGLAAALAAGIGFASAQSSLADSSPFLPASGGSAGASAQASDTYELAGVAISGSDVAVCIFERAKKQSRWISVGETTDGIKVLRYDEAKDHATVTIAGAVKELYLRKAAVSSALAPQPAQGFATTYPAPAPAPSPPVQTQPGDVKRDDKKDEKEARMLVSDLLEIGIQQRKAYEEAKRKNAGASPAQPLN